MAITKGVEVPSYALMVDYPVKELACKYSANDSRLAIWRCDEDLRALCDLTLHEICWSDITASFGETTEDIKDNCVSLVNVLDREVTLTFEGYCPPCFDEDSGEANTMAKLMQAYASGVVVGFQYTTGGGDSIVGYGTLLSPTINNTGVDGTLTYGLTIQSSSFYYIPCRTACFTQMEIMPLTAVDPAATSYLVENLVMGTGLSSDVNGDLISMGLELNTIISATGNNVLALLPEDGSNFMADLNDPLIVSSPSGNCCLPVVCQVCITTPASAELLAQALQTFEIFATDSEGNRFSLGVYDISDGKPMAANTQYCVELNLEADILEAQGMTAAQISGITL